MVWTSAIDRNIPAEKQLSRLSQGVPLVDEGFLFMQPLGIMPRKTSKNMTKRMPILNPFVDTDMSIESIQIFKLLF
jgi:hypothetical protein